MPCLSRMMRSVLAAALLLPLACAAQQWPSKPVTLMVGFTPGGGADAVARVLGAALGPVLGQTVVIENRPGAGSSLAASIVARSAPDGYTVLIASPSAIQVNPILMGKVGYDAGRDFAPVTQLVESPLIIAANMDMKVNTLDELVARVKKEPGKFSYSSSGIGSASHLAGQLFEEATGAQLLHVPYKGGAPAIQAVVGGETQIAFASPPSVLGFLKADRLKGLAVTDTERLQVVSNLPGIEEAGLPQFRLPQWYGLFVPAQTPREVREKLFAATRTALQSPGVAETLMREGNRVQLSPSPEAFASFLAEDAKFWTQTLRRAGIKAE